MFVVVCSNLKKVITKYGPVVLIKCGGFLFWLSDGNKNELSLIAAWCVAAPPSNETFYRDEIKAKADWLINILLSFVPDPPPFQITQGLQISINK